MVKNFFIVSLFVAMTSGINAQPKHNKSAYEIDPSIVPTSISTRLWILFAAGAALSSYAYYIKKNKDD